LAERGNANAAYELALTYDMEVLAKAGIGGVDGDADKARAWYEYAAREGHAGAADRLKMLARPRDGA
jgi:TPR repeat protein